MEGKMFEACKPHQYLGFKQGDGLERIVEKGDISVKCMSFKNPIKSRGYVKEQFAWRHFYWYLTNEGIQYLRDYLHLPPEIVPATLRRSRPETGRPRPKGLEGERPARLTRGEADRDNYRRSAVPLVKYTKLFTKVSCTELQNL
uniref:Small ribosomal subunit protein eS10 n=1 Tax=Spermophilus dauricus TaxID=99837 RepID=A0A8C9QB94_SPEDA